MVDPWVVAESYADPGGYEDFDKFFIKTEKFYANPSPV